MDVVVHELGNAHLCDVSVVSESHIYVLHVATSTCEDDTANEFVGKFNRNLIPSILHNLLNTCLYKFDELAALYLTVAVDAIG